MKNIKFLILATLSFMFLAINNGPNEIQVLSSKILDANQISTAYTNYGLFNYGTDNAHFNVINHELRAISGIWIGARVNSQIRLAVSDFDNWEFLPGYIDANGNPQGKDDSAYRVYKIVQGNTISPDYLNWPSDQGAYLNNLSQPYLMGKQTLFYSYTDGYSDNHNLTLPLKAQILQTNWAYDLTGPLGSVIFSEIRIINRSSEVWNDAYIGFWSDDEIGLDDDGVDSDSTKSLGLTYCINNNDPGYGAAPPVVGFKIFSGPFKYTGSNNDSVVYYLPPGSENKIVKRGFKNLFATSNNIIINGSPSYGDPQTTEEYYNLLKGLKRNGQSWINPMTNQHTNFPSSLDNNIAGDSRMLLSSGPLNISPGDTQIVVMAQLPARGGNNLESIYALRAMSNTLQNIFNCNFCNIPNSTGEINTNELPRGYELYQNYPNPFNPKTIIRYSLAEDNLVSLKVFDVSGKEISALVNQKQNKGRYEIEFNGDNLPSGIYFYRLTVNNLSATLKMILLK